ncbi:hypothetical protein ACTI_74040 [Actinoplanes sp. OR16]|uniref:hypothetical protein n=1 Tax=Actinoplanes sp. OR16 TaxID=946334 RepID=UPI000F71F78F|nr:hypothetical protein [Actinoplanes sp. OR16]BBH70719.1 hypothetical protein ACTI_74040 [Actinoplanes sp. OR16]
MSGRAATPPELAGAAYEQAVRRQAQRLKDELIRQTLEDVASWKRAVDDKWAGDHPDLPFNSPIPPEEVEQYRERVRTQDYEWIVPTFERLLVPDPDELNPAIDALAQIEGMFEGEADFTGNWVGANAALVRINDVRTEMSGWQGAFSSNFTDNFLTPLQNVVPNHRELMRLSRDQLECTKAIYCRFRKSVLELLDKSIQAVQSLGGGCDPDVAKWGTITAVVIGTVLGPVAAGWGLVAAVILDAGGTFAGGLVPSEGRKTETDLAAPTATEIAMKIHAAVSTLGNDLYSQEEVATAAMQMMAGVVGDHRSQGARTNVSGPFVVATPALADATPAQLLGGAFRPA